MWYEKVRYYSAEKILTVLLRAVFLRGTKLRHGMFFEEYSAENSFVPYRVVTP